jgi:hypothetical protein
MSLAVSDITKYSKDGLLWNLLSNRKWGLSGKEVLILNADFISILS